MKLLNKALTSAMIIAAMFMANGCSVMEGWTGSDFAAIDRSFRGVSPSLSEKSEAIFQHDSAYVVFNKIGLQYHVAHPSVIFEVIDGKVVLAGLIRDLPGRAILKVKPGEHTYIKKSRCGLYSVTVDAKRGYVYQLRADSLGSPSLMSWCKDQGAFKLDNSLNYRHMSFYQNYTLVKGTEELAAEEVDDWGIQEMYDDFITNTDEINPRIKMYVSAEEGERI